MVERSDRKSSSGTSSSAAGSQSHGHHRSSSVSRNHHRRRGTTGSYSRSCLSGDGHNDDDEEATRNVRFSDRRLVTMALDAARGIHWDVLRNSQVSSRWSRRKSSNSSSSSIAVYTREDTQSFAVLAKAQVPCSLQELKLVFDTRTSEQFSDVMQALCQSEFIAGELVHLVATQDSHRPSSAATRRTSRAASTYSEGNPSSLPPGSDLVVNAITFEKANVFARNEEWCFLDYVQEIHHPHNNNNNSSSNKIKKAFTKTMLALDPDDCFFGRVANRATHGHDVLAGFLFEEDHDGRSSRVTFSGEHFYGSKRGDSKWKDGASHRIVKARLMKMVQWIYHLSMIVRRRRLGIQVLADRRSIRVSNPKCVCCRRSFMMARKKICALCGCFVCDRCSEVEQRETRADTYERSKIEQVRVCDTCMVRVDQCRYTHVSFEDLRPVKVVPDAAYSAMRARAPTTGAALTSLLQETMQHASEARKASALSVIKYLVDQEDGDQASPSRSDSSAKVVLTDASTERQHFDALQCKLNDTPLPLAQCVLGNTEKRNYPIRYPEETPNGAILYPIPPNEQERLALVKDKQYQALSKVPELDIICSIASKELECSGSMVTIVDDDSFHVIATTMDVFDGKSFPRNQGFCNQVIMSDKPLLLRHAESDVRFANIIPVAHMDVSFYCGFPLVSENNTVIGSVCCVNHESRELTQTQYTVMKKLAETASKVVQREAKQRQVLGTEVAAP